MKNRLYVLCLLLALVLCLAACQSAQAPTETSVPKPELSAECAHADADDNKYCDQCGGYVLVSLEIFALNDLHGKFVDTESQPGVDELSTYLTQNPENTILLSSGDMWQGSSESNLTQGKLMTEWMNEMDFVSMTLGNHEFDWGTEAIEANQALADFPFLAINVYDRATNTQADFCQSSVLVQRAGLSIGIIGAIGDCYSSISADKTEDIYFKTGDELTKLVKAESQALRAQGADIIVYALHDGYDENLNAEKKLPAHQLSSFYDTELSDGYVDLVFEAHIHKHYVYTDEYGVYHLQGGGENAGISQVRLTYNVVTDTLGQVKAQFVESDRYDDQPSHDIVNQLLFKYEQEISPGHTVLGTCGQYLNQDDLRQLIAQLYYEAGMERWGSRYDIVLGGGFISVRNPWSLEPGQVQYSMLQSLFPFDNQIQLCSVKGQSLLRNFFESQNENYYIYFEEYGLDVWNTLDPNATYYIITDSYSSSWAANELTVVEAYDEFVYARDLLADYIAAGSLESDPIPTDYELTDIPTLLQLCRDLDPGQVSQESYFVKGTVVSIANTKYGNMTITDDSGHTIYIYGTYDATGAVRYDGMENPPQVGDTVILWGKLQHYVPKQGDDVMEMIEARIIG